MTWTPVITQLATIPDRMHPAHQDSVAVLRATTFGSGAQQLGVQAFIYASEDDHQPAGQRAR